MPGVQHPVQSLGRGRLVAADHTGGLHQRAPAGVCLKAPLAAASAQRSVQGNRHVTDFAGKPMRTGHDLAVTHDGSADADIAGQVNEGVGAVDGIQEIRTSARITGNLRDGGHLRLVAGTHIVAPHDIEPGQVDVLPIAVRT